MSFVVMVICPAASLGIATRPSAAAQPKIQRLAKRLVVNLFKMDVSLISTSI